MSINTRDEIKNSLKRIIAVDLDSNIELSQIGDDVSLYEDGIGLDSIAIVNLIVLIEKKMGIGFDDAELSPGTFNSINSLTDFVQMKLTSKKVSQ